MKSQNCKSKLKILSFIFWFFLFNLIFYAICYALDSENQVVAETNQQQQQQVELKSEIGITTTDNLAVSENVTLDFKDADIRNVLKIISLKSGVNIVTTPDVMGNVTIRLIDVPWEKALDVILKTYGYGYEKQANIITVAPIEKLTAQKKQEVELAQVQPTMTEVFTLRYIDAQDAKKAIEVQLSPRGKITALEMTGQSGWEFGGAELGKRRRVEDKLSRSKVLIVTDVPPVIDKIKEVIDKIDVRPAQVLIEARIMEVSRDKLRDLGIDWGTGTAGAAGYLNAPTDVAALRNHSTLAGRNLASEFTPGVFKPEEGVANYPGTYPYKAGLEIIYKKLTGSQFEVILHALEEDVHTNTLSAPRVMALNNQEAAILVGTKYPILKNDTVGAGNTAVVTTTLDYYQDIGIQLNVVPQVGANNFINMVIHPAVTTYTTTLGTNAYPIIDAREAETRILMKDGETVVIGGLLKDLKSRENIGIPFLSKIPIIGAAFTRQTNSNEKIDLLIFISAHIVKEGEFNSDEIAKLEKRFDKNPNPKDKEYRKAKKEEERFLH